MCPWIWITSWLIEAIGNAILSPECTIHCPEVPHSLSHPLCLLLSSSTPLSSTALLASGRLDLQLAWALAGRVNTSRIHTERLGAQTRLKHFTSTSTPLHPFGATRAQWSALRARRHISGEAYGNLFRSLSTAMRSTHCRPTAATPSSRVEPGHPLSRLLRTPLETSTLFTGMLFLWRLEIMSTRSRNTRRGTRRSRACGTEGAYAEPLVL